MWLLYQFTLRAEIFDKAQELSDLASTKIDSSLSFDCTGRCSLPLGMEDKRILDGALSASSYASIHLAPWRGRINSISSWSSRVNNARQWLQINFGNLARCTGIATQGRRDSHQWVTRYVLSYGNGVSFKAYREKRKIRVSVLWSSCKKPRWRISSIRKFPYIPYSKMAANKLFFCLHVN